MLKDHQYFEERLLTEATLSPEEAVQLQEHLQTCESCQRLSRAWREVEEQLVKSPVVSPAPGFIRRWQVRLMDEREKIRRRQTTLILSLCVGGAILSLLVVGFLLLPLIQSPYPYFLVWTYQVVTSIYFASSMSSALGTVMQTIYELMPPTLWIAVCIATGALCALWIFTIQKLTSPRRVIL
jgi:predicted anti-sigma-YlaC factor YlaD